MLVIIVLGVPLAKVPPPSWVSMLLSRPRMLVPLPLRWVSLVVPLIKVLNGTPIAVVVAMTSIVLGILKSLFIRIPVVEVNCRRKGILVVKALVKVALTHKLVPPDGGIPTLVWWPWTLWRVLTTCLTLPLLVGKPRVVLHIG